MLREFCIRRSGTDSKEVKLKLQHSDEKEPAMRGSQARALCRWVRGRRECNPVGWREASVRSLKWFGRE